MVASACQCGEIDTHKYGDAPGRLRVDPSELMHRDIVRQWTNGERRRRAALETLKFGRQLAPDVGTESDKTLRNLAEALEI